MILVGVTGQTGSGKTTFAQVFLEIGAKLIDADAIGHKLYKVPEIKQSLIETFGDEIVDENGEIERTILSELVFSDLQKLELLNNIVSEPLVNNLQTEILKIKDDGFPGVVIVDAALLPRWNKILKLFQFVVLIDAPRWQRINRLVENRDLSPDGAEMRIDVLEKLYDGFYSKIDYNIKNSGNLTEFRAKIVKVWLDMKGKK